MRHGNSKPVIPKASCDTTPTLYVNRSRPLLVGITPPSHGQINWCSNTLTVCHRCYESLRSMTHSSHGSWARVVCGTHAWGSILKPTVKLQYTKRRHIHTKGMRLKCRKLWMLQSITCYNRITGRSFGSETPRRCRRCKRHASVHSLKPGFEEELRLCSVCLIYVNDSM